jgi:hypothetical protein
MELLNNIIKDSDKYDHLSLLHNNNKYYFSLLHTISIHPIIINNISSHTIAIPTNSKYFIGLYDNNNIADAYITLQNNTDTFDIKCIKHQYNNITIWSPFIVPIPLYIHNGIKLTINHINSNDFKIQVYYGYKNDINKNIYELNDQYKMIYEYIYKL